MLQALREACASPAPRGPILLLYEDGFEFVAALDARTPGRIVAAFSRPGTKRPGWRSTPIIEQQLYMLTPPGAPSADTDMLRLYVPLCAARHFFPDRVFVIAHMAQTLDGKIATASGDSKWIGNEQNLLHAHRMRALVDGVLVGGVTAHLDLPALTVRHVEGANPARIILSNTFDDVANLPATPGTRSILVRSAANGLARTPGPGFDVIDYAGDRLDIRALLAAFRGRNIHSILIEGGPMTLQSFLAEDAVDLLQLHIAPVFFGAGKCALQVPAAATVDAATPLRNSFVVPVGDGVMITGQL